MILICRNDNHHRKLKLKQYKKIITQFFLAGLHVTQSSSIPARSDA